MLIGGRASALFALCLLATLGSASGASASTTIGPETITVQGAEASATITRSPFAIAFRDAAGHTVLSEAPAPASSEFTLPVTPARLAAEPPGPALYAPLSFLVGSDRPATLTGGSDAGDLASVEENGTEYFAREVLAAEPEGEGVRLLLATSDPTGRTLRVTVTPQGAAAIRVEAAPSEASGVAAMADSFASGSGEAFHGFGGRHNALNQSGQTFYNWVDQENVGSGSGTDLSPDGPQAGYYVQSQFVSNDGYGFLVPRPELTTWRMDSEDPAAWQAQVSATTLAYVVAPGAMSKAIATLTSITGRQRAAPNWAIGPTFDRLVAYDEGAAEYEAQLASDLKEIKAHALPVSAYRVEGWRFLSPEKLESEFAALKGLGIKPLVYFRAFLGDEVSGETSKEDFETAVHNGYFADNASGEPFLFDDNFGRPAGLIDFTNPAAAQWWRERIEAALELGAEGFMLDFGEQVQPGMHFHDGTTAEAMHNAYPVLYERVTREAVEAFEAVHPGRQIAFYTRAGYSGEPGSAAYESFNFPGDETTDWSQSSGLASLTRDMLNRAIGGAYGYSTDIGGYFDLASPPTTHELFVRWAEWAALSPLFRLHGALTQEHTPWARSIRAVAVYRKLSELHLSAAPLIEALWHQADETGMPITRPLYLQYPQDPRAAEQDQEWLLGPDVLVAPVVEEGARARSVYFPAGCWRDPETGLEETGPASATVPAQLNQLPFFFACGSRPFTPSGKFGKKLK